jgi:hypothetical protein
MDEDRLKMDVRLYCAEWLSASTLAVLLKASEQPQQLFETIKSQTLSAAKVKAFPGLDPAMSDLLSAELESGLERLLGMTASFLGKN